MASEMNLIVSGRGIAESAKCIEMQRKVWR